jgi:outer membrane protein insertion porin family
VLIVGLEDTKESIAYNQVTHLTPESILTRAALERDINQLYNTGLFETVTPDLQPSLKEGYAKVVLNVTEARTGQVGFGLGYSTLNGIQGSVNVSEKNLFGSGKQIDGSVTISDRRPSFNLTYTDRYFSDDTFWSLGLYNVHSRQQRYPGTAYESKLSVDSKGGTLSMGKKLNDYDSWQVGLGIADYDYNIVQGDPFRGYSPRQRARLSARGQTRKVTSALTHDTRDNIFSSTEGVYGQLAAEFAGFGGDFAFNKWALEGREFYPIAPSTTLALRQRLIIATGNVPIYEEAQYGGVLSVRGLPEDQIFGTKSFLSNVEVRHRFSKDISIAAFLDSAWAGESFSDMDNATGIGFGPRIKLKFLGNQPIRLDYGIPLSGTDDKHGRFHFYFGEMF